MLTAADAAVLVFGLGSALSWGAADFSGGLASRRSAALGVVIAITAVGLLIAPVIALARGEPFITPVDMAWAGAASLSGTLALATFYRGLALGRMSVVATIGAVVSASFPVALGSILEGAPAPLQLAGMVLGIVSIAVVTLAASSSAAPAEPSGESDGRRSAARVAIGLAVVAGLGFGGYYVLIDQVAEGSVFWPMMVGRVVGVSVLLTIVTLRRSAWVPVAGARRLVLIGGILDLGGTSFFMLAAQSGRVDVAAVLSSLYPVTTIILAALVLRERINAIQGAGIAGAIGAIVLIAAG